MKHALFLIAIVALAPLAAGATAPDDPHVTDATGDVDVQHLVEIGLVDAPDQEQVALLGDIERAWVGSETEDTFTVYVELVEIPNDENLTNPVEVWSHFRIEGTDWHAAAQLSKPDGSPTVQAAHSLWRGDERVGPITGQVDQEANLTWWTLDKEDVKNPGEGDRLTQLYITTHLPDHGRILDYAPGEARNNVQQTAGELGPDSGPPDVGLTAEATFGAPYTFGQFPVEVDGDLRLQLAPTSIEIPAGEERRVAVTISNMADAEDTVEITTGGLPSDWSVYLDESSLTIGAGDAEQTFLHVRPSKGASGQHFATVKALSEHDVQQPGSVAITVTAPPQTGGGGSGADTGGDAGGQTGGTGPAPGASGSNGDGTEAAGDPSSGNATEESNGAPLIGPVATVATVLGAALVAERRRRSS